MELRTRVYGEYGFYIGSGFRNGAAKTFYEHHIITNLLPYIKVDTQSDDTIRTIHSAKGTEFANVLIHFETTNEFTSHLHGCRDGIHADEDDARVYYVGCSRARERLFLNIPEADESAHKGVRELELPHHSLELVLDS